MDSVETVEFEFVEFEIASTPVCLLTFDAMFITFWTN